MSRAATYDMTGLERQVSGLSGYLFGAGATEGQLQQMLKTETGQLAARMGDAAGPRSQSKAMAKIDAEIRQQLSVKPSGSLNLNQESESYADFTWLYASPNALVGINDEDNQRQASGAEALEFLRAGQHSAPRGNAYIEIGSHGKQKIMRLNRVRVSASAFNYVRRALGEKTGQLRAAFYAVAKRYVPAKTVPAWIAKKIPPVEASGKSRVSEIAMDSQLATIEFAITSAGVTSNDRLVSKLQGAIERSRLSIASKMEKVAKGAVYVWNTGKTYFQDN